MSITRRRFIQAASGLFVAPAIVRAENLMKIWVPPQGIQYPYGATPSLQALRDANELLNTAYGYDAPWNYTWLRVDTTHPVVGEWHELIRAPGHVPESDMKKIAYQMFPDLAPPAEIEL